MRVRFLCLWVCGCACLTAGRPALALPRWAREYGVGCGTCHSIPPRLNGFGLAFQANQFNWPAGEPPARKTGLAALPISGIAEFSHEDNRTEDESSTRFRELRLFFTGGFRTGQRRPGGYFVSLLAATNRDEEADEGDLDQAFVAFPVAGRRGQWSLTAGQFSGIMFQWERENELTSTSVGALADELDRFSFAQPGPGLRVDYFDHRGQGTADGRYLTVGVPFEGHLALNSDSHLGGARGVFAHAFRRRGEDSLGAFAFAHAGNHLAGIIGTHEFRGHLSLLGTAAVGEDDAGSTRRLSLEGECIASARLAVTARLEAVGGERDDVGGAAALTYYPFTLPALRLTLETTQRKGNRSIALIARGQF